MLEGGPHKLIDYPRRTIFLMVTQSFVVQLKECLQDTNAGQTLAHMPFATLVDSQIWPAGNPQSSMNLWPVGDAGNYASP